MLLEGILLNKSIKIDRYTVADVGDVVSCLPYACNKYFQFGPFLLLLIYLPVGLFLRLPVVIFFILPRLDFIVWNFLIAISFW